MDCNTPAGKDEYYTTCADFDVVAGGAGANKIAETPFSAAAGANPQSVAVKNYQSRTAYVTSPSVVAMENNKVVGSVSSVKSAFVSSCSAGPASGGRLGDIWVTKREAKEDAVRCASFAAVSATVKRTRASPCLLAALSASPR